MKTFIDMFYPLGVSWLYDIDPFGILFQQHKVHVTLTNIIRLLKGIVQFGSGNCRPTDRPFRVDPLFSYVHACRQWLISREGKFKEVCIADLVLMDEDQGSSGSECVD